MHIMQNARIGKNTVWYDNAEEFNELKKELYTEHRYYLELDKEDPVIIDAGAHIGLATLYFKQIYPDAKIIAIEPHPANFALLKKNIEENQLKNVELYQVALAPKSGQMGLNEPSGEREWRSGVGIIVGGWRGVQKTKPFRVKAVGIAEILGGPVDLLKMDIEGMEYEVLKAAGESLRQAKQIIVEVHPREGHRIGEIVKMLNQWRFNYETIDDKTRWGKGLTLVKAVRQ